jgi:hypothetical protein
LLAERARSGTENRVPFECAPGDVPVLGPVTGSEESAAECNARQRSSGHRTDLRTTPDSYTAQGELRHARREHRDAQDDQASADPPCSEVADLTVGGGVE